MFVFKTVQDLQDFVQQQRTKHQATIGFVPTMGALHDGHLSLLKQAQATNTISICSIFVNPTQFDDPEDLARYPKPVEKDMDALLRVGCSVLFLPEVEEIYPTELQTPTVDLQGLDRVLEGAHRKGHFDGVVQVVHRLLDITKPDNLYMGQKDYQQWAIIQRMLEDTQLKVQLHRCPIIREEDGLAMSSRNVRLSTTARTRALHLSKALFQLREAIRQGAAFEPSLLEAQALLEAAELRTDYLEIVHGDSLQPVTNYTAGTPLVACAAVHVDGVRLIDNVLID